jgi:hypothetical protein
MAQVPGRLQAKIGSSRANPQEIADVGLQIIETPPGRRHSGVAGDQAGRE